jgi:AcrR family transcriptional regulator
MVTGGPRGPELELTVADRVVRATKACCERWGRSKVTIDDIATESGVSRATIYRLFPGGKDVLLDALREREIREFFQALSDGLVGASSFEDLVVRVLVTSTAALEGDVHLKTMLGSAPGDVATDLTVEGLPRIVETASAFLTPWFAPHIGAKESPRLAEWLSRVVISYFLAPSRYVELSDPASARAFTRSFVLPAFGGGSSADSGSKRGS